MATGDSSKRQPEEVLETMGYKFAANGVLVSKESGEKYTFPTVDDVDGRSRHEEVRKVVGDVIMKKIETSDKLERVEIVVGNRKSFFFASKNWLMKRMINLLIPAVGRVYFGQWDLESAMKYDIDTCSQLADVEMAQKETADDDERLFQTRLGVVLLNINATTDNGIPFWTSPEDHLLFVWKYFLEEWNVKLNIVTHGSGLEPTFNWFTKIRATWTRIRKIAAVCPENLGCLRIGHKVPAEKVLAWIHSEKVEVHKPIPKIDEVEVACVSAGRPRQSMTMLHIRNYVWAYLYWSRDSWAFLRYVEKSKGWPTSPQKTAASGDLPKTNRRGLRLQIASAIDQTSTSPKIVLRPPTPADKPDAVTAKPLTKNLLPTSIQQMSGDYETVCLQAEQRSQSQFYEDLPSLVAESPSVPPSLPAPLVSIDL